MALMVGIDLLWLLQVSGQKDVSAEKDTQSTEDIRQSMQRYPAGHRRSGLGLRAECETQPGHIC